MSSVQRVEVLRARMLTDEVEAAVIIDVANMRYLTGFDRVFDEGISAAVVVGAGYRRFYTDSRYIEASRIAAEGTDWDVRLHVASLFGEICDDLHADGAQTLSMESSVTHARFAFVSDRFKGRVVVTEQWVEQQRAIKDETELAACAAAATLTDAAFDHILGIIRPGLREIDISLALEVFMRSNGSDGLAFEPIVASGPNTSRPHAGVTMREMVRGDLLTMDFGARIDGYCADMTRTVVVGAKASDEQRRIYEAVLAANMAGLAAVRPGARTKDVDAAARDLLAGLGLAEFFGHGLGHGVGLRVHELPSLSFRSDEVLRTGSVVTIEPGVYVPGFGGVRIEDLVAVRESGGVSLSHAPKDLIEIM